jgi:serine/arginine repetitive matrix protein 1
MSGSFYRGTTTEQDGRFANKEKKIIRKMEWPEEFDVRVDIKKVTSTNFSDL